MRLFLFAVVIACLVGTTCASGQPADSLPSFDASRNFIAVKIMGTPTFLLINGSIASIGVEYSFHKRHSVGVSFSYVELGSKYALDDSVQEAKGRPYAHAIQRGIMLYYRYYTARCLKIGHKFFRPYAGGFARMGNGDVHFDKGYETNQVSYDEREISAGALLGTIWDISAGNVCLDVHIGPFYKWKSAREVYLDNGLERTENPHQQGPGVKVGFTLTCLLPRKK